VPAIYVLLVILFVVFFLIEAGHGSNPFGFVVYLSYPAAFLLELLPVSWSNGNGLLVLLLFLIVGLIQWAIVGWLIGKLLALRRERK
jgi:hypothetical protein